DDPSEALKTPRPPGRNLLIESAVGTPVAASGGGDHLQKTATMPRPPNLPMNVATKEKEKDDVRSPGSILSSLATTSLESFDYASSADQYLKQNTSSFLDYLGTPTSSFNLQLDTSTSVLTPSTTLGGGGIDLLTSPISSNYGAAATTTSMQSNKEHSTYGGSGTTSTVTKAVPTIAPPSSSTTPTAAKKDLHVVGDRLPQNDMEAYNVWAKTLPRETVTILEKQLWNLFIAVGEA
ncbi:unnamed protein product, partial [Amoebophrya sp. A25]